MHASCGTRRSTSVHPVVGRAFAGARAWDARPSTARPSASMLVPVSEVAHDCITPLRAVGALWADLYRRSTQQWGSPLPQRNAGRRASGAEPRCSPLVPSFSSPPRRAVAAAWSQVLDFARGRRHGRSRRRASPRLRLRRLVGGAPRGSDLPFRVGVVRRPASPRQGLHVPSTPPTAPGLRCTLQRGSLALHL